MDALKLFALTASWFGRDEAWRLWKAAQEAANKAWHAAREAWEAADEVARDVAWGTRKAREAWEAKRIAHLQVSFAILYRKKWGQ